MSFSITTSALGLALAALLFLSLLFFGLTRYYLKNQSPNNLVNKHKQEPPLFRLRYKYPEVDAFGMRSGILLFGLAFSISLAILAFAWTTYETKNDGASFLVSTSDEIEMETPRTAEPPPPPPPPPAPAIVVMTPSDLPDLKTQTFEDQSLDKNAAIIAPTAPKTIEKTAPPPPPPPPKPVENVREIFKIVEQMPLFAGCEDIADKTERTRCSDEKIMQFLNANLAYPPLARENNVQGMVVVRFVVEPDGSISNYEVIRDIGGGCGEEAVRVIKLMPKWTPGKQREHPVRVQFTLPIKFKLA